MNLTVINNFLPHTKTEWGALHQMSDLFPVEVDVILSVLSARFTPKSLETCELVLQEAQFRTQRGSYSGRIYCASMP